MKKKINIKGFSLCIGDNGWFINPLDKKYYHLVITSEGIYMNGEIIANGKLTLLQDN